MTGDRYTRLYSSEHVFDGEKYRINTYSDKSNYGYSNFLDNGYITLKKGNSDSWGFFNFAEDSFGPEYPSTIIYKDRKIREIRWSKNGQIHKEEGPAIMSEFSVQWYANGKEHNFLGPSSIYYDGENQFCIDGKPMTEEVFKLRYSMLMLKQYVPWKFEDFYDLDKKNYNILPPKFYSEFVQCYNRERPSNLRMI